MSPVDSTAGNRSEGVVLATPASVPDRIAVVVNGNAKNVTAEVISTLDQILLGGDLFVSRSLGEVVFEGPARLVGVATIPYYGYGLRAFPFAEERADRMHLRVSNLSVPTFVRNFRGIWRGEYHHGEQIADYLVQRIEIRMTPPTPFQMGGDFRCETSEKTVSLAPRRIRLVDFYAPPSAS